MVHPITSATAKISKTAQFCPQLAPYANSRALAGITQAPGPASDDLTRTRADTTASRFRLWVWPHNCPGESCIVTLQKL